MMDREDVEELFEFHPATPATGPIHDKVRKMHGDLAERLFVMLPECPERTLAVRHLQQSMMFANAAIAIHTPS